MFIQVSEKKIKIGIPMINSIPVLVKPEIKASDNDFILVEFYGIIEGNKYSVLDCFGTRFIKPQNFNDGILIKMAQQYLSETLNIDLADLKITLEETWKHEDRPVRLYIPGSVIIENDNFNALVVQIKQIVPYYPVGDGYIIYLQEIYPDHLPLLQSEESVIIENI